MDREELLQAIEKAAAKLNIVQPILLEVNIGAEASKSGFTPEEAMVIASRMAEFPTVNWRDSWQFHQFRKNPVEIQSILHKCISFLLT